ncbi:hypothetical protein R69919_01994 [Paraburkholderia gardini]|nr:hypothetical protein R69919_01994 [Paraburkholderia gardini]
MRIWLVGAMRRRNAWFLLQTELLRKIDCANRLIFRLYGFKEVGNT